MRGQTLFLILIFLSIHQFLFATHNEEVNSTCFLYKIDLPQNQLNHLEQQYYAFSSSTSAYLKHFDKAISDKKGAISNSNWSIALGNFYNIKNTVINIPNTFAYSLPTQNYNNDPLFLYNECPATTVNLNTAYSISNLPAGTNLTWHTSLPATNANKMADVSTLGSGTYYAAFYDATNDCYGDNGMATIAINVKIISCTTINNECPATTVNLNTAYSVGNLPAGTSLTWHTSLPARSATKIADVTAIGNGTYYAVFYDATNDCYGDNGMAAIAVNVELVSCTPPITNECPATTVNLNTAYSVSNLPADASLTWHTSLPATNANKMANASAVGSGTYYAAFYDATNDCYPDNGMSATAVNVELVSCTPITNECPATTVNLNTAYSVSNLPADASLTWHTSLPATNANKMANASAVGSGTYYAAFYDATNDCYPDNGMSATAVNVELVPCGEICDNGIDDDGDGAIDCADGDCANYEPLTLMDDNYATCPGFLIERFLKSNDVVTANAVYLLKQAPTKGVAVVQENGTFSYNSFLTDCLDDSFVYQVCDTLTGCCAEAMVFIDLSDTELPQLDNLPEDETVHCDEILPTIPSVSAFDNCPEIAIEIEELSTQGEDGCSLHDYELTRIWTAIDQCGNAAADTQKVRILDITAPDIFRIYTLPNGKKMVAGVMENVTHRWKTIPLPIDFPTKPLIFTQVISDNDPTTVATKIRNVSVSQFNVKLQEEEANLTTGHQEEMVAWVAIEAGDQEDYNIMNVAEINLNHSSKTINFQNAFNSTPAILTNLQTAYEKDPATVRYNSLTTNMVNVRIAEETSLDAETNHLDERMAYWALEIADTIKDIKNNPFGESGVLPANDQWTTINTVHSYTNPVVIANGLSDNDPTPAVVRVRNVTDNSFEVKVQEWAYADGNHGEEMINYVVVEGSIPLDASMMCNTGTDGLILGKDIIAIDNCDPNVSLAYHEAIIIDGNTKRFIRSWYAQDECGNETGYGQEVPCIGVGLQIKAMLQGAMLGSSESNLMRDDLRKKGTNTP